MKTTYTILLLLFVGFLQSQNQIGQTVEGTFQDEIRSMDYSENGKFFVTGSTDVIAAVHTTAIEVNVYKKSNNNWVLKGSTIKTPQVASTTGTDVEISEDGNTIMVTEGDRVYIYKWSSGGWLLVYQVNPSIILVLQSITLSSDGKTAAFAKLGGNAVTVEFHTLVNGSWSYHSNHVFFNPYDWGLCSLELNKSGDKLVIGTPWEVNQGRMLVLSRSGSSWSQ